jgi:4-carboxymuconolactone decarboxylase
MSDHYYNSKDLQKFGEMGEEAPQLAEAFFSWYGKVFEAGALTKREKALIGLGVSHAVQCPYCIEAWSDGCLEKGADAEEMTEAVHIAAAIRGGASLVHGVQMRNHLKRLGM